jgi:hypothetical protein
MKVAFCTHVSDNWYYTVGADKLVKSANNFHKEIDFYCFGDKELNELFSIHPNVNWNTVHPFITYQLIDNYDMVVHFDADSMIVGKLNELLNDSNLDFDIIGVRNNNDYNRAGKDNYITNPGLDPQKTYINFQSRLGKDPWLTPYTDETLMRLAKEGKKRILVFSPSFTADCLETIHEVGAEYNELFQEHGGEKLVLVPSMNCDSDWIQFLQDRVLE